jgi:hypothetical protein
VWPQKVLPLPGISSDHAGTGNVAGARLLGDHMRKIAILLASVMIVTAPSMALAAKKKAKRSPAPPAAAAVEPAPVMPMMCCQDTAKMFQIGADAWKTPNLPQQ